MFLVFKHFFMVLAKNIFEETQVYIKSESKKIGSIAFKW